MTSTTEEIEYIIDLMSKITLEINPGNASFETNLSCVLELDDGLPVGSNEYANQSSRSSHVMKTIELLARLKNLLSTDTILSVSQCATVSRCIYSVMSLGLIPCLIPFIWEVFDSNQKSIFHFTKELSVNNFECNHILIKKYENLKFIVNSLFALMKDPTYKRLIIAEHPEVLLAALCQLCFSSMGCPSSEMALAQWEQDQILYEGILTEKILMDKDIFLIREILLAIGHAKIQEHLKCRLKALISDLLLEYNGVQTLLRVACDLAAENTKVPDSKDIHYWSNIINGVYYKSSHSYNKSIVPQVWDLIRSKENIHQYKFRSIGVFCVHLMFSQNYDNFLEYYLKPIGQSMSINRNKMTEMSASLPKCIDDLYTLFYFYKAAMWSLNPKQLMSVASTIYNLYTAIELAPGSYHLKSKLEDLVFLILTNFSDTKEYLRFILFSQYVFDVKYDYVGNIIINLKPNEYQLHLNEQLPVFLDLIDKRFDLKSMKVMFVSLLDMYTKNSIEKMELDEIEISFIVKSMLHLIVKIDQKHLIPKDPNYVINLVILLLNNDSTVISETLTIIKHAVLYVLKNIDDTYISQLNSSELYDFSTLCKPMGNEMLKDKILNICLKIKKVNKSCAEESIRNKHTIPDVLNDIRDSPKVQIIMEIKKLIDSGSKTVLARRRDILTLIEEYLNDADLYVYLSAIFTLTSLGNYCPEYIITTLCKAYLNPKMCYHSSETRLMISKVLMKMVRPLNSALLSDKYQLLKTFMANVRDDDHLLKCRSLSCLAEVCDLLCYDLGSNVPDIVNLVDHVLRFVQAVEPRRAAVLLFLMVIHGCSLEQIKVCQVSITRIYVILKYNEQYSKDIHTKSTAQEALECLHQIMYIFKKRHD